jgi:hypothetical protein
MQGPARPRMQGLARPRMQGLARPRMQGSSPHLTRRSAGQPMQGPARPRMQRLARPRMQEPSPHLTRRPATRGLGQLCHRPGRAPGRRLRRHLIARPSRVAAAWPRRPPRRPPGQRSGRVPRPTTRELRLRNRPAPLPGGRRLERRPGEPQPRQRGRGTRPRRLAGPSRALGTAAPWRRSCIETGRAARR